jgi:hypothetical protein
VDDTDDATMLMEDNDALKKHVERLQHECSELRGRSKREETIRSIAHSFLFSLCLFSMCMCVFQSLTFSISFLILIP